MMFADTLSGLRYSQGLVWFKLHASSSPGSEICMPIADFIQVIRLFEQDEQKLRAAHKTWLAQQVSTEDSVHVSPIATDSEEKFTALGKRLASI